MIPIFRAKKLDSDEYVSGYLKFTKYNNRTEYAINYVYDSSSVFGECEIEPSTLSIHFPDMLDSQRNKIFASLQENGKGGDIIHHKKPFCKDEKKYYEWAVKFDKRRVTPFIEREYWNPNRVPLMDIFTNPKAKVKVIGIKQ